MLKLSLRKIASVYLVVSFFITPVSALLGMSLGLLADWFIVLLALATLLHSKGTFLYGKVNRNLLWILPLIFLALIQVIMLLRYGISFEVMDIIRKSRGILIFLITLYVYIYIYSQLDDDKLIKIDRIIDLILKINIGVILLEGAAINLFGGPQRFAMLFEPAYMIQPNPFLLFHVPNGLVMGYQHSGILAVAGIFRWAPWLKGSKMKLNHLFWLIASVIALALTMTVTAILTLAIVLWFSTLLKGSRTHNVVLGVLLAACLVITIVNIKDIMAYKLGKYENFDLIFDAYKEQFADPIKVLLQYPVEGMLGSGHVDDDDGSSAIARYSDTNNALMHSDFGFGDLMIRFGAILVVSMCVVYFAYLVSVIKLFNRSLTLRNEHRIIMTSVLISMSFVVSIMHYTTLFKYGVMQFSAALLALSSVLIGRHLVRRQRNTHGKLFLTPRREVEQLHVS